MPNSKPAEWTKPSARRPSPSDSAKPTAKPADNTIVEIPLAGEADVGGVSLAKATISNSPKAARSPPGIRNDR